MNTENPGQPAVQPNPATPLAQAPITSTMPQGIYPEPIASQQINNSPAAFTAMGESSSNLSASSAFDDMLTFIFGVASSTSYLATAYLIKNLWATAIISVALAFGAIYFAMRNYHRTNRVSPLSIVGLSSATFSLIIIANLVIEHYLARSLYGF